MVNLRTTPAESKRLAELRQAATPGPWTEREDERNPAHRLVFGETMDVVDVRPWPEVEENAALIVAARNALPDLLADLAALESECGRLAGELDKYTDRLRLAIESRDYYSNQMGEMAQHAENMRAERDALARRLELCQDEGKGE